MKGGDDRMAQRTVAICNGKYIGIETIYEVEIFSESYGYIAKKDFSGLYQYDWNVPFGFNTNDSYDEILTAGR